MPGSDYMNSADYDMGWVWLSDIKFFEFFAEKSPGTFSVLTNGMTAFSGHIQYVNMA